eukprot:gene13350-13464_t
MTVSPLPVLIYDQHVRAALLEDLGRAGDLTSDLIISKDLMTVTKLVARQEGAIAGLGVAKCAFQLVDPAIRFEYRKEDGETCAVGDVLAIVSGPARGILTAERTALNYLSRLSGIASATAALVAAVKGHKAQIVCTRKTTPGLRALEKYAVRCGGGSNHRFGLDDAVLIKDNHVAIAGGVANAVMRARAGVGHLVKIELEVDTLAQLDEALALGARGLGVDVIMLDNMSNENLKRAVEVTAGRALLEASGRVNLASAPTIAATGVDLISVGWMTHSAAILDIGLDHA